MEEERTKEEMKFRYVCPHCLRTFLDDKAEEDRFCWKCGEKLIVVGNYEGKDIEESH